jgi:opacity protein-like surface antigen
MKKLGVFLLAVVAIALISSSALAQVQTTGGDNTVYFVTYYSNNVSGAPDATLRFINDGSGTLPVQPETTGSSSGSISLAANIYVFDDSQELIACGACWVSADGILSEDVKTELTNNPLTGRVPSRGVIKIISGYTGDPTSPGFVAGLRGWATHIQRATPTSGAYVTTEAPVEDANINDGEAALLTHLCYYAGLLGSGQGTITCTQEDHDF